jgi:NOL1/NOP2/fmu family ribosome biogenesis protein
MSQVHTIDRDQPPEHAHEIRMEVMRSEVSTLTPERLEHFIGQLEEKMGLTCKGDRFAPLTNGFRQFFRDDELDPNGMPQNVDLERIQEQKRRLVNLFSELYHRSSELGIKDKPSEDVNGDEFRIAFRLMRLIETADDAYEIIFRYVRSFERINSPTFAPMSGDMDSSLFRCKTMDTADEEDDASPYQRLLLYLLNKTYTQKMKRYKGQCCKQIETTEGGHLTRAWKPVMEIKEFVYFYTQKEDKYDMWRNMTSKGSIVRDTVTHLSMCRDIQFPEIHKNRTVWSFQNGIFVGKEWSEEECGYMSKFYPYGSNDIGNLDPTVVSCKYFDQEFPEENMSIAAWQDIKTPVIQSIMEYQRFSNEVMDWMYVFIGRLCFDTNDQDAWQVIPFLKGIAGSGKSTIITKVCKRFYDPEDVRTLSNNIEKKFGLWSIHDGFMFISPEVKGDLALEQAEFQSMVSGEDVSIARKNEKALSMTWNVPGILGGNEVPSYRDNSGSVLRRLVTWNFARQVSQPDPQLDGKLEAEIPTILCKCVRAYLDYSRKYSKKDIWSVLPPYFKTVQSQVATVTNPLQHFLASDKLVYGVDKFIPQKLFVQIFNQHCQENVLGRSKFNEDIYAGPFSSREIDVKSGSMTYRGKAYANQKFIHGVDAIEDNYTGEDIDV